MNHSPSAVRVALVFFDAGGGHRAAAAALAASIKESHPNWDVQPVQLMEVLDPQGRFLRVTGLRPEDYYNRRLARGWTLGLAQELKLLQGLIGLGHDSLVRKLQQHWLQSEPDLVVSLVPNFNRALGDSVASCLPGVPFVTVMTDLADHPPNFWFEPGVGQHLVCGTARAVEQARAAGCEADHLHRVSGMILNPAFYANEDFDIEAERTRLGLPLAKPVGLVMFGGQGSSAMVSIARALHDRPLILLCGRNEALAARLRAQPSNSLHRVVGFTHDVKRWMSLSDYFIGKPGPGSLSEAVHMRLPVVTIRNAWTMPQERYNTDWVRKHGLGLVVGRASGIRPAVLELMRRLSAYRSAVSAHENRAVFEVPGVLASILRRSRDQSTISSWPSLASTSAVRLSTQSPSLA